MSRLSLALTGVSLVLLLALAACGLVQQPSPSAPPAEPATPSASPTAAAAATPERQGQPVVLLPTPSATPAPAAQPSPTPFTDSAEPSASGAQVSLNSQDGALTTVDVVKALTPSVVQVVTQTLSTGIFNQPIPGQGVGTGIIIDPSGLIMTNNHVIAGAQRIRVTLPNGDNYTATVIGTDDSTDLAVIKIDAAGLQPARLGTSAELQVGEDVIAIGQALGLPGGPTVTKGVISALGRTIDTDPQNTIVDLIQTDAEINPGNSGGPLVNARAEVIGINTAIIQSGRGIGFAINIDDAKLVVQQLIENGFVNRGFLGISPVTLSPGIAARLGLNIEEGILVARVIRDSAADRAGLQERDVIMQLGQQRVTNTGELSKFLLEHPPGDTVEVTYIRNGSQQTAQVTLDERPR